MTSLEEGAEMEDVPEIELGGRLRPWVRPLNPQQQRPAKTGSSNGVPYVLRELAENLDSRPPPTPAEAESLKESLEICDQLPGRMRV